MFFIAVCLISQICFFHSALGSKQDVSDDYGNLSFLFVPALFY